MASKSRVHLIAYEIVKALMQHNPLKLIAEALKASVIADAEFYKYIAAFFDNFWPLNKVNHDAEGPRRQSASMSKAAIEVPPLKEALLFQTYNVFWPAA